MGGREIVKQVKFERLEWAGFLVRKDSTRISKKKGPLEHFMKEDLWQDHG